MSNVPTMGGQKAANDADRQAVLTEIGTKWSKFSKQDLSALKTNDELVSQIVAKYGVDKAAAQRDVDTLMHGRKLAA